MPFSPCITFVATSLKSRSIRYKYVHFMPVFEFSPEKNLWPWNWALKMAKIFSCTVKKGFKKNSTIGRTLLHENTVAGQLSLIKKITFEIQPIFQLLMQTFHTNPVKISFFTYYIIYTVHVNEAWYEKKGNFDWICMEGLQEEFFQSVLPLCCFPNCLCVYFFYIRLLPCQQFGEHEKVLRMSHACKKMLQCQFALSAISHNHDECLF